MKPSGKYKQIPQIINPTKTIIVMSSFMRRSLLSAFWIAVIVSGLVFVGNMHFCNAQSESLTSIPAAIKASGGNGSLELAMTIDKTSYSIGEPVNLTLTITNISNQTINYTHTGLDFDFQVINGTNNVVYQWSNFKAIAQFIAITPLPAGESTSANFTWQQICNFNTQVEGDPVSPGTYNIVGETGSTYKIQTAPIQVTIGIVPTVTSTPTPTPTQSTTQTLTSSPSPTVPEFPTWIVIALVVGVALLLVALKKNKNDKS
jgi:hypothetical protein